MQQWTPFWRWLATGVLAAMTIAWLAQVHPNGREAHFTAHARPSSSMMQGMAGMMGSGATVAVASPVVSPELQRRRAQLQQQAGELQTQRAQLNARLAALQARVSSLGQ